MLENEKPVNTLRRDLFAGLMTLGHVHSSSFRSLALTALRLASHHLPVSRG
ncbi:MAG: hypothetical protein Q7J03_00110 [Methanoregula sp.]|nr:hypothetical protein [Methanoregula sp.]